MSEVNINCPHCKGTFELTEALAAPYVQRQQQQAEARAKASLATERDSIAKEAAAQAQAELQSQLMERDAAIQDRDRRLAEAQALESAARKAKEEAETLKREAQLQVERAVSQARDEAMKMGADEARQASQREAEALRTKLAQFKSKLEASREIELSAMKARQEAEEAKREVDQNVERARIEARELALKEADALATQKAESQAKLLKAQLQELTVKLEKAQFTEEAALKAKREADEAKRTATLEVERRLATELDKTRDETLKLAAEENRQVLAEKEKQLEAMRNRIEDLKRAGSAGSQKFQGDVAEEDLAAILAEAFPDDQVERIKSGQSGADIVQKVRNPMGNLIGSILWERKQTKAWQPAWLPKLKDDQRSCKADASILVSAALPDDLVHFDCRENVWVSERAAAIPLAAVLRRGMFEASRAKTALAARSDKKDDAYHYLTGNEFLSRVHQVMEPLVKMQGDLLSEQRSMKSIWSRREKELNRMFDGMSGMYGDLQGIFGSVLPKLESLELPGVDEDDDTKAVSVNADNAS